MIWLTIAAGGALGSMARYGLNNLVIGRWPAAGFPLGIMLVNILGCFAIGLLAGLVAADRLTLRFMWREFLFVGVLGGFTTFSAFGLDTLTLLRSGAVGWAILNVGAQVVGGLVAVWAGYAIAAR